jgi:uncharacterized membrane protein
MLELFEMWALLEVLGIIFLPLTVTVFHNLPDRGWAFSKALALAALAFCVWLPLMCFQSLPFSQFFILGVLLLLVALNLLGYLRVYKTVLQFLRSHSFYIVCVELVFLGMVFLLGWLRSYSPDIRNFEMFMDEGFLAAIMRSTHFPPNDMWYSGRPINYYYYAHYNIAVMAKLLGQTPSVAFNTGISSFFGLTAVNLFGVTANLVAWAQLRRQQRRAETPVAERQLRPGDMRAPLHKAVPYGILSILLGLVLGNLAATQTWWQNHGDLPSYYWFNSSRVIINTINEFPAFSFLLSCFHAHVLALAFTILAIGLALNILLEYKGQGLAAFGHGWRMPLTLVMTAIVIGSLYAMNGWDYPTYLAVALVCLVLQQWLAHNSRFSLDLVLDAFTAVVALGALSYFLFAPFYLNFVSPAQGLGLVGSQYRTPLVDEVLIYGIFAFILLSFLLSSFLRPRVFRSRVKLAGIDNLTIEGAPNEFREVHELEEARSPAFQTAQDWSVPARAPTITAYQTTATGQFAEYGSEAAIQYEDLPARQDEMAAAIPQDTQTNGHLAEVSAVDLQTLEESDIAVDAQESEEDEETVETELTNQTRFRWSDIRLIGLAITLIAAMLVLRFMPNSLTFVVTGSLSAITAILALYHLKERERAFALLLGAVACALVAFCEVIFLKDVFAGSDYLRMNTVFKFYFQAWAMLSIAGGAGVYFVLDSLKPALHFPRASRVFYRSGRIGWSLALLAFLLMGAVYPLTAPGQRYNDFTQHDFSLDGLDYMSTYAPGDYSAILWINSHIQGDPVIIEAIGDDYSDYARISAFTGLPTPMGWIGHEIQWRINWMTKGNNQTDFNNRANDVKQIYTDPSQTDVLNLMARYNAQYLYVGPLEEQTYVGVNLQRFSSFMKVVYQQDGVTIYQVP